MLIIYCSGETIGNRRPLKVYTKLPFTKGQPEMTEDFWNNLTFFVTGIIAHITDLHELHRSRILNKTLSSKNFALPQQVKIPSIFIKLSSILPSLPVGGDLGGENTEKNGDGENAKDNTNNNNHRNRKEAWAQDFVEVKVKGVEPPPRRSLTDAAGTYSPEDRLCVILDAHIRVIDKSKFSLLRGTIDREVAYNARSGQFLFRIRRLVGEPILETLQTRIKAIDRLVTFLDAIRSAKGDVVCERVTLRQVTFTYAEADDEKAIDENGNPSTTKTRWRACLNLTKDDISISFEKGNPHLAVQDLLNRLVNDENGLRHLIFLLTLNLPILRAVAGIRDRWQALDEENVGFVDCFPRALDWLTLRYTLPSPSGTDRVINIDMKVKMRRSEPWWHFYRTERGASPGDDLLTALKTIWSATGKEWRGLSTGAAARPGATAVVLLEAIDNAIRSVIHPDGSNAELSMENASITAGSSTQQTSFSSQVSRPTFSQRTSQSQVSRPGQSSKTPLLVRD
jgi:mediator of RNA polymerase II transcription subunit 14